MIRPSSVPTASLPPAGSSAAAIGWPGFPGVAATANRSHDRHRRRRRGNELDGSVTEHCRDEPGLRRAGEQAACWKLDVRLRRRSRERTGGRQAVRTPEVPCDQPAVCSAGVNDGAWRVERHAVDLALMPDEGVLDGAVGHTHDRDTGMCERREDERRAVGGEGERAGAADRRRRGLWIVPSRGRRP